MPRQKADPEHVSKVRAEAGRRGGQAAMAKLRSIDAAVQRVVDRAPELTTEQRDRLAAALAPSGGASA